MNSRLRVLGGRISNIRVSELPKDKNRSEVVCNVHFLDGTVQSFRVNKQDAGQVLLDMVYNHLGLMEREYFGLQHNEDSVDSPIGSKLRWLEPTKPIRKQLKAELGDYSSSEHPPGYLSKFHFIPDQDEDFLTRVGSLHNQHRGLKQSEAELCYLNIARTMEFYGVELHSARDPNNAELLIGIASGGLPVFRNMICTGFYSCHSLPPSPSGVGTQAQVNNRLSGTHPLDGVDKQFLASYDNTMRANNTDGDCQYYCDNNELIDAELLLLRITPDEEGRFGFNVKGGVDQKMPLVISRVSPDSPQLYRKKPGMTILCAKLPQNIDKNRYKDVLPYDNTRVALLEGEEDDYINANFVNMAIPSAGIVNKYVASQGPLPHTCSHFWQAVWEQHCAVIVMLTTLTERGKPKCHQYWPDPPEVKEYGNFQVCCHSEDCNIAYVFRELTITNTETGEERSVTHLQYVAWPDHGVPDDPTDFLDFVNSVRQKRVENEPLFVHCSKGAPRGVQDVSYSLEIASSNPGYVTADHDREFLGGSAQLAERCLGREGLGRQGNPRLTAHQRPLWPIGHLWLCSGAARSVLSSGAIGLVALLWICSAKNDGLVGARFGGRVFQLLFP
ncbi:UNVERIFIED_CONTAM: hypothetical protein FKN15_029478 [Acipenser sinensis]